jgi:hypothetical protein
MANYLKLMSVLFLVFASLGAQAQTDSTIYQNGLPVSSDDSVRNFPSDDYYPRNAEIRVRNVELPQSLLKALNDDSLYRGWQKLPVLYNKNTKIYTVRVITKTDTAYYGFNDRGKPVTYGKKGRDDQ